MAAARGRRWAAAGAAAAAMVAAAAPAWAAPPDAVPTQQQAQLTPADGVAFDRFGTGTAVQGDAALVGATDTDDRASGAGSVYAFTRSGTTWTQRQELTASDGAGSDGFGFAIDISGDTAVISATRGNGGTGAAYVFVRDGVGTWTQQAELAATGTRFASDVAVSGDTALVGIPGPFPGGSGDLPGEVAVFQRTGTAWSRTATLTAADPQPGDEFGFSVALDGSLAAVGAVSDDEGGRRDQGTVTVFRRPGAGAFTRGPLLSPSGPAADDEFGYDVDVDGATVLVGARQFAPGGAPRTGAAFVFTDDGTAVTQQARLVGADTQAGDDFAEAVALDGDVAVLGARFDDSGSAYVFTRDGTAWSQRAKLVGAGSMPSDLQGDAVAVDAGTAVVGARLADTRAQDSGTAYVFAPPGGAVPAPVIPEAPAVALLPLVALGLGAAAVATRRQRAEQPRC